MSVRRTCMATQDPAPCCALVLREAAEAAEDAAEEEDAAVSAEAEVSGAEAEDSMLALTWFGVGLGLG